MRLPYVVDVLLPGEQDVETYVFYGTDKDEAERSAAYVFPKALLIVATAQCVLTFMELNGWGKVA